MYEEISLSFLSLIISVMALIFTGLQYLLANRKRKDALFELRYKYYESVSHMWVSTCDNSNPIITDPVSLAPIAHKGLLLFGKDIQKHILSLEGKKADNPFFPDLWFDKPFYKYLKL